MKRLIIGALTIPLLLSTSCSGNDAELEKELNIKIDNYSKATIEICACVETGEGDCAEERKKAADIYNELSVVNENETETKLDPEVYSSMLESIALINSDYANCTRVLFKRLNE